MFIYLLTVINILIVDNVHNFNLITFFVNKKALKPLILRLFSFIHILKLYTHILVGKYVNIFIVNFLKICNNYVDKWKKIMP